MENDLLDKNNFKSVKDYLVELKLPIITSNTDKNLSYMQNLEMIGSTYEGIGIEYEKMMNEKFLYQSYFYIFAIIYLIEKYGKSCMVLDIANIRSYFSINSEDKTQKYRLMKQIMNCIKDNKNVKDFVMVIPVAFAVEIKSSTRPPSNHANMLIYKSATNTMEHFEPHGQYLFPDKTDAEVQEFNEKIVSIFRDMITTMNAINMKRDRVYYENDIEYIEPSRLCPNRRGFQLYDEAYGKRYNIEGGGFCMMWSMFYAEMSLLNPDIDGRVLLTTLLDWLKQPENSLYARNIIRGYIHIIMNELTVFENEFKNKFLNKKLIEHSKKNLTAIQLLTLKTKRYFAFMKFITEKYNKYNKTKFADIFQKPLSEQT